MNINQLDTITTADEAREAAIDWQAWQSDEELSYGELIDWTSKFEELGEKFELTTEFSENGII